MGERRKKELPFASRSVEWQSMTRRTEANRHGIVVEEDFSNVAATGLQGRGGVLPPDVDAFPPSASREIPTLLLPRPRIELPDLLRVPVSQSRDRQPWDVSPPFRRSSVLQIDPERPMRNRTVNPLGSSLSLSLIPPKMYDQRGEGDTTTRSISNPLGNFRLAARRMPLLLPLTYVGRTKTSEMLETPDTSK